MTTVETVVTKRYSIDPAHSVAEFAVKHMMVSTVKGRFQTLEGAVEFDEANPAASTVTATVDVASIDTGQDQRDAHLRSEDFFDAERYPSITFRSTGAEATDAAHGKIFGELTIRGVTREIELDTEYEGAIIDAYGKHRAAFNASTEISRKDYSLTWNPLLESGGAVVGDRVRINLYIAAVRED